jgi:hypothetical protein
VQSAKKRHSLEPSIRRSDVGFTQGAAIRDVALDLSVELFSIEGLAEIAASNEFPGRLFASSSHIRNVRTFFSTHRPKFEANAPIVNLRKRQAS